MGGIVLSVERIRIAYVQRHRAFSYYAPLAVELFK